MDKLKVRQRHNAPTPRRAVVVSFHFLLMIPVLGLGLGSPRGACRQCSLVSTTHIVRPRMQGRILVIDLKIHSKRVPAQRRSPQIPEEPRAVRFAAASKLSPVCEGDTLDIIQRAVTESMGNAAQPYSRPQAQHRDSRHLMSGGALT